MTQPSNIVPNSDSPRPDDDGFTIDELDVTCPGCDTNLTDDHVFQKFRICPGCGRHFWIPAREHVSLLLDTDSFREINNELVSTDPLLFRDSSPGSSQASGLPTYPITESLVTGIGRLGGREVVAIGIDFALLGDAIGVVAGEKIVLAIEKAASRRLPLVSVSSSGSNRSEDGLLSLLQFARIANSAAKLENNGTPMISLLSHPSTGGVFAGFASHANFLFAEPGAEIGLSSRSQLRSAGETRQVDLSAAAAMKQGSIDGILDRRQQRDTLINLVDVLTNRSAIRSSAFPTARPESMRSSMEALKLARHKDRPSAMDIISRIMPGFVELHGDRIDADDMAVRIGLGAIDGVSTGVIIVNGRLDDSGNGGLTPASYRKAARLQRLVSRFEIPLVTLVDHSDPSLTAEQHSAALASQIAAIARTNMSLPVPTVAIVIGEAQGAPALAFALADRTAMLENAVISGSRPERTGTHQSISAGKERPHWITARECLRFHLIDAVVPEPIEGAQHDPATTAQQVRLTIIHGLSETAGMGPKRLADERFRRFRNLGLSAPIGNDALSRELAQFQDLQRTLGKSIDEVRIRLETYSSGIPARPGLPHRPNVPDFGLPAIPNLPTIKRPAVNKAEITEFRERLSSKKQVLSGRVQDAKSAARQQVSHIQNDSRESRKPLDSAESEIAEN